MGISTHYYTVCGIKHDWLGEEFHEAYDEAYDDSDLPTAIFDCMCGEYIVLGEILYDSGDLRWNSSGDSFQAIDVSKLPEIESKYKQNFTKKFPEYAHLVEQPFQLMTFVHYS